MTLQHDEDVEVYLNGKLVFQNTGHVSEYQTHDISSESADVLQTGKNVVAVHCRQTVGGQFIDLGLECFEEAVDLVGLIRKHGNKLMGEGPHKQYKARMRDLQRHLPTKPKSDYYKVLAVGEHGERVTKVLRRGNPALEGEEFFRFSRSAKPARSSHKILNHPEEEPPWPSGLAPKIIRYLPGSW